MANPEYDYEELESDEPLYPYTIGVRDLFTVNLVAELEIQHEDCVFLRAPAERRESGRCYCPSVPYYYLGRKVDRELGIFGLMVAGPCSSLAELETLCRDRIKHFRALANQQKASQTGEQQ